MFSVSYSNDDDNNDNVYDEREDDDDEEKDSVSLPWAACLVSELP